MIPGGGFEASGAFSLARTEAQDVSVSASASGTPFSSDSYSVTTKAEIDEAAAEAAAAAAAEQSSWASQGENSGAYYTPAQQAEGDDYPWWNETPDDFGAFWSGRMADLKTRVEDRAERKDHRSA